MWSSLGSSFWLAGPLVRYVKGRHHHRRTTDTRVVVVKVKVKVKLNVIR